MNSERNIINKLNESSFEYNGSTYTCVFGRYSKDGEIISRDEYFKARDKVSPSKRAKASRGDTNDPSRREYTSEDIVEVDHDDLPVYLYHATFDNYLDSIAEHGLGSRSHKVKMGDKDYDNDFYNDDGIFLCSDPKEALEYVSSDERNQGELILLRVPKSALKKDSVYYDTNNSDTNEYLSSGETSGEISYFYKGVIKNPQDKVAIIDH